MSFARPWLLLLVLAVPLWWWLRARRLAVLPGTELSDARPVTGADFGPASPPAEAPPGA